MEPRRAARSDRAVLEILNLSVRYQAPPVAAVNRASLVVRSGETLGLIGESGSGKSTLAHAVLKLLPPRVEVAATRVALDGIEIQEMDENAFRTFRWRRIAYVPQAAMNSLIPVARLADQFTRIWRLHEAGDTRKIRSKAEQLFSRVGLDDRWLEFYPHELSGGMRQRAIIAFALMFNPALIIADEPTTGLDVLIQRQVLELLKEIQAEHHSAMIFVSHDIAVISEISTHIAVMYGGEIVEAGTVAEVLTHPLHPYTMGLIQAFPDIRDPHKPLVSIEGVGPRFLSPPTRCPFIERCPFAQDVCRTRPPSLVERVHSAACHFTADAVRMRQASRSPETWQAGAA